MQLNNSRTQWVQKDGSSFHWILSLSEFFSFSHENARISRQDAGIKNSKKKAETVKFEDKIGRVIKADASWLLATD